MIFEFLAGQAPSTAELTAVLNWLDDARHW